jgi:16S rRNA C967 or C1407 C5-methylase (RsmB/RsmF family)
MAALTPGGTMVYATCSLEAVENEEVLREAGFPVEQTLRRTPGIDPGDGFFAAVLTSK